MTVSEQTFAYRQKTFAIDDVAGMTRAMHDEGFALIPGVLSAPEVKEANAAIDQLRPMHWDSVGATDHYKNVFNQSPYFLQFIDRAGVADLAESVLGADCHIIGETAWRSHPTHDGGAGGMHIDQLMMTLPEEVFERTDFQLPHYICTAHYYLSDITEELCPTLIIPGSHKAGRGPKAGEGAWHGREPEPVLCRAGDVLFFRSEIWHSGSRNATADQTRYLLQVHYGIRNTAQHFSPFLTWQFNPKVLEMANPRQRRLLGDHKRMAYD